MVGPWFLQAVLEAKGATSPPLSPVKLSAKGGLAEEHEPRKLWELRGPSGGRGGV